jgi:hypothetical protein
LTCTETSRKNYPSLNHPQIAREEIVEHEY